MKKSNARTKRILQPGRGAMCVLAYRSPSCGGLLRIEADMKPNTSGVELTPEACKRLWRFLRTYLKKNVPPDQLDSIRFGVSSSGPHIDVLPEHAEEVAGRIAAFVTDPANHVATPEVVHAMILVVGRDFQNAQCMTWTEGNARTAVEKARREVETKYPEFIADPLGDALENTTANTV